MKSTQKGASAFGVLFYVCVFALTVIVGLKVTTHYMDFHTLSTIFDSVARQPDAKDAGPEKIKTMISKELSINSLGNFALDDAFYLDKSEGFVFGLDYEVREHLFANVDLVLSFSHEAEVK